MTTLSTPDPGHGPEPLLTVADDNLQAAPGGMVQTRITLTHRGPLVESFALDVVGLPRKWWDALPPTLELLPDTSKESVITFRPPAGTTAPETALPFGVRAVSKLNPRRSVVEEGELEIAHQPLLRSELVPLTARARWRGRHVVRLSNGGNVPLHLELTARDPNQDLAFLLAPAQVMVPVNGSSAVRLKARVRKPQLRGKPERLPFEVTARPRDGVSPGVTGYPWALPQPGSGPPPFGPSSASSDVAAATLHGEVERRPVISPGTIAALLLVSALLVGLGVFVLKTPTVVGARHKDSEPAKPTGLRLLSFDGPTAMLQWTRDDNALHRIEMQVKGSATAGKDAGSPDARTAPPYTNTVAYVIEQARPETTYCFHVVAMRGELFSERSAPVCGTMAETPLQAPTITKITRLKNGTGMVTWNGGSPGDATLLSSGLEGVPDGRVRLTRDKGPALVPLVTGNNCFVAQVSAGGRTSPFGKPRCVDVPAPTTPVGPGIGSSPSVPGTDPPSGPTTPPTTTVPGVLRGWAPLTVFRPLTPGRDSAQARDEVMKAAGLFKTYGFPDADWRQLTRKTYSRFEVSTYVVLLAPPTGSEAEARAVCDRAVAATAEIPELRAYRRGGCTPIYLEPVP